MNLYLDSPQLHKLSVSLACKISEIPRLSALFLGLKSLLEIFRKSFGKPCPTIHPLKFLAAGELVSLYRTNYWPYVSAEYPNPPVVNLLAFAGKACDFH